MRAKGKFKDGDLIYKTNSKRKKRDEQATIRIVAVKRRNEPLISNVYVKIFR